jgi:hypothetical protein
MIRDTSRSAFERVQPKITRSQEAVLQIVRAHPEGLTNAEIAYYMGIPINRVTPRRNELTHMGLLVDDGIRSCRVTHSSAHAVKARASVLPPAFPGQVSVPKDMADTSLLFQRQEKQDIPNCP